MSPVLEDEWAGRTHFQNAKYFMLLVISVKSVPSKREGVE
jgi:hypothetical protein